MDCGPMSWRFTHPVPSPHSHVSLNQVFSKSPPKSTWHSRKRSNAMAVKYRSEGPVSAICVHSVPSHTHVSPNCVVELKPPKSTTRWRAASYAILCEKRRLGPMSSFCVQSQRSLIYSSSRYIQSELHNLLSTLAAEPPNHHVHRTTARTFKHLEAATP